jgi:hypothetical protein
MVAREERERSSAISSRPSGPSACEIIFANIQLDKQIITNEAFPVLLLMDNGDCLKLGAITALMT